MKVKNNLTLAEINELFIYDEKSPTFLIHKTGKHIGRPAGSLHNTGYFRVKVNRIDYKIHRILYQIYYDIEYLGQLKIDHIDNNRRNNKKENLRIADNCSNMWNRSIGRNNKTGIKGLRIVKKKSGATYYVAKVNKNYENYTHNFKYNEEGKLKAIEWLNDMRNKLHGEYKNCG